MDPDKLSTKQQNDLRERLNLYIETSRSGISHQTDSFSAMDSKTDFLLASLGVLISVFLGIITISGFNFSELLKIDSVCDYGIISLFVIYVVSVVLNFYCGLETIKNRDFSFGRDVHRIRDLDRLKVSNLKILIDISTGLEDAYGRNIKVLEDKVGSYKITQRLWIINLFLTIILIIIVNIK